MPDETKRCPYCGEEILAVAIKCKHCGSVLKQTPSRPAGPFDGDETVMPDLSSPEGSEASTPDASDEADATPSDGATKLLGGRYELREKLGEGGMGIVHKAYDMHLNTEVAVKLLPEHLAGDSRGVEILKQEALASMKLSHPNIVRLHNFEDHPDGKFLVMELIDGKTLDKILAISPTGKLSEEKVVKYALEICKGLGYAHEQGIIHRDIKPSNIIVTWDGEAKVADFGIARALTDSYSRHTGMPAVGTLFYMSPEQILGQKTDARSDIYSLGITLYELLDGEVPFLSGDIATQHKEAVPPPIEGIPGWLQAIVSKCIEKKPHDRFQNIEELTTALIQKKLPSAPRDEEKTGTARAIVAPKKQTASPLAAVLLAIILFASIGYAIYKKSDTTPPGETSSTPTEETTGTSSSSEDTPTGTQTQREQTDSTGQTAKKTETPASTGKEPSGTTTHEPAEQSTQQPSRTEPPPTPHMMTKLTPERNVVIQKVQKPVLQPDPGPINRLAVLRLDNDDLGFSSLIRADLAQSGLLPLANGSTVKRIASEHGYSLGSENLQRYAEIARASKLLSGIVTQDGEMVNIKVRVTPTDSPQGSFNYSAKGYPQDIIFLAYQLANRVHRRLTGRWIPLDGSAIPPERQKLQAHAGINPAMLLSNPDSSLKIRLNLDRPGLPTYEQKSTMQVRFSVNQNCYIALYNIDSAGVVTQLFPNEFDDDYYVHSGVMQSIPSPRHNFDFVVSGDGGLESIIAIASTQKIFDEDDLFRGEAATREIERSPGRFITRGVHVIERVKPADWTSETVHFYLVPE